jgi:hypothetical protein
MLARLILSSALVCTQLVVAALPAAAEGLWLPGPDGAGSATYTGSIDRASGTQVIGWVVDTTAQGWSGIDEVQLWSGLMSAGGQMVAHASIQLDRPDVAAALGNPYWSSSGFSATLPPGEWGSGGTLYVYVHTPSKGWWYESVSTTTTTPTTPATTTTTNVSSLRFRFDPVLDLETPTPLGTVHSARPFTVQGFAYDRNASPDQGTGIDRVQVYVDGDRSSGIFIGEASLGKPDAAAAAVDSRFVNAGWQLMFQPNSWMTNLSDNQILKVTVYARSSVTGKETSTTTSIVVSVP